MLPHPKEPILGIIRGVMSIFFHHIQRATM